MERYKETILIILAFSIIGFVICFLYATKGVLRSEPVLRSECEQIEYEIENARRVPYLQIALQKKEIAILQGKCLTPPGILPN